VPQNSYKFDKNTFDEFDISRVSVTERGSDDWVAFMWSKHGQEAIGRGENMLEALTSAVEYLTQSFRLPPSMFKQSESLNVPQSSIRRNRNNRILRPAEQILDRFSEKKKKRGDMEVVFPNEDLEEIKKKKDIVLPYGYDDVQGGYMEVTVTPSSLDSLRENFDNMPTQEYSGSKRFLMWVKTLAGRIKELSPLDAHRGPIVATAVEGKNTFYYYRVSKIDRELVVKDAKEPIIVNFSRHENFQIHIYGLDQATSFPSHVPEGESWTRIDLDD